RRAPLRLPLVPRNGCGRPGRAPERFLPLDITSLLLHVIFDARFLLRQYYFKAPWMPDRTEANPNELNQDDARYGFRCCHLKNIWTAPLPPETELSRQMTTSTTSIDIMGLQAAYANLHTDQERDY